jgi:rRNA maturation endonuclease Nob1
MAGGRTYVDDNFGTYEIESEEDIEFYHQVQKESVWKTCQGCGRRVKLRPDYGICNSCADKAERGWDLDC